MDKSLRKKLLPHSINLSCVSTWYPVANCRQQLFFTLLFCLYGVLYSVNTIASTITTGDLAFQRVLENKDVNLGEVRGIIQDSQGFIWFGGVNALIRYDGYTFKEIRLVDPEDPSKSSSIRAASDIFEDSTGNIWVSTRTGVYKYDVKHERAIRFKDDPSKDFLLSTTQSEHIVQRDTGEILIATFKGLLVFDTESENYRHIAQGYGLASTDIKTVFIAKDGTVWLGTAAGISRMSEDGKSFTNFQISDVESQVAPENSVLHMTEDSQGWLWLATLKGLVHFNPETQERKRFLHNPDDNSSLSSNEIWRVLIDSQGIIWLATDQGGINIYDAENDRFIRHMNKPGDPVSLSTNVVRTIFEDRGGDIWIGNYPDGIHFFDRSSTAIGSNQSNGDGEASLSHNSVLAVSQGKHGNLWLGTDGGGLNYFDRKKGTFKHFRHNKDDTNSISSDAVLSSFIDNDGKVWIGTWGGGISILDPKTNTVERIPFDSLRKNEGSITQSNRLNNPNVWSIYEDSRKNLWIGTHSGGLSNYDRETKTFTHYWRVDEEEDSIASMLVWTTFEDSKGNFWVGTTSGVDRMDRDTGKFKNYLPDPNDDTSLSDNSVLTIFEDSKSRVWFGTDGGLNLYQPDSDSFIVYSQDDGLLNDTIRNIQEDKDGNLWISTNNGFSILNPETGSIKNINRSGGRLIGGFNTGAGVKTKDGKIIFGGVKGFRVIDPEGVKDRGIVPKLAFTDLKIFSESVEVGGTDSILTQNINHTEKIILNYKKSMFDIHYSALSFRDPEKSQYSYMLEGFDTDWSKPQSSRNAKYTNLNPGTYHFKFKASNNAGLWTEAPKSLVIVQLPPPWKTWWAYTIYVLLLVTFVASLIQKQRLKRQAVEKLNKELERKVKERTLALTIKNNDIQAMLSNMEQGLLTIEDGETIHPEYSARLEEIYETSDISGRNAVDFLLSNAELSDDMKSQVDTVVRAAVGENIINFDFNAHLLPREFILRVKEGVKHIACDWNPIAQNELVEKLMVSVRDITQLKEIEKASDAQRRELAIIGELLEFSRKKIINFFDVTKPLLDECRDIITAHKEFEAHHFAQLFRDMHTIKGAARTLGLTSISDTAHNIESYYIALKEGEGPKADQSQMVEQINTLTNVYKEYSNIFYVVLGRGEEETSETQEKGFWINNKALSRIKSAFASREYSRAEEEFDQISSTALSDIVEEACSGLPQLSRHLDKDLPKVAVDTADIRVTVAGEACLAKILTHLLSNSMDHGIELPEERTALGKSKEGNITIQAAKAQDKVNLTYFDDGGGLNIDALRSKGEALGKWNNANNIVDEDIAAIIFEPGISTKEIASEISGRGVGLDAVKHFVEEQGGNIDIQLMPKPESHKRQFRFTVTLPISLFI